MDKFNIRLSFVFAIFRYNILYYLRVEVWGFYQCRL